MIPSEDTPMVLRPVGTVRNGINDPGRRNWEDVTSEIMVVPEYAPALEGIEEFSHVLVLFWMHRLPPEMRTTLKVHPRRRADLPLVGVFATRSQARPNPLGLAAVKLVERRGNVLKVIGLDALDGTPVIDIKPYLDRDRVAGLEVAGWVHKLDQKPPDTGI